MTPIFPHTYTHITQVALYGGSDIQVWGTMDNNRLLVMEQPQNALQYSEVVVKPKNPKLKLCSYIAFTSFVDSSGVEVEHIWLTYKQRSVLVSFNARTREQRCILNCAEKLKSGKWHSLHYYNTFLDL